jgi:hypothetical protein
VSIISARRQSKAETQPTVSNGQRGGVRSRPKPSCPGAPWVIKTADLTGFTARKRSDSPLTPNPDQRAFDFQ